MGKKIIGTILLVLLGGVFIFSGTAKYLVMEEYEIMLVKQHLATWGTARFVARLIVGFELVLGLLLIIHYKVNGTVKWSLLLIAVMSVFLGAQIALGAELENCYCFGETWQLSNTESLIKNAVMLLMGIAILKMGSLWSWQKWGGVTIPAITYIIGIVTISILNPPINIYGQYNIDTFTAGDAFPQVDSLGAEAYKGEVLLGFYSPTCVHCKQAAMKMQVLNEQEGGKYTTLAVFGFGSSRVDNFMEVTGLTSKVVMLDKKDFMKFTKGVFPQIYHLRDGQVQHIWNKEQFIKENL